MTLDDYPILKTALEKDDAATAARVAANPNPRGKAPPANFEVNRVAEVLAMLTDAIADGEILNPRYLQIKDTLNRAFRMGYDNVFKKPYLDMDRDSDLRNNDAWRDLYYGEPTLHTAVGFAKKIAKAFKATPDAELIRDTTKFIMEITPLSIAVNGLKDKVVKVKRLTPKEREEANIKARYTAPPSSSSAVAQVHTMLDKFVNDSYESLVNFLDERNNKMVNGFLKAAAEVEAGTYKTMDHFNRPYTVKSFTPYEYFKFQGRTDSYRAGLVGDAVVSMDSGSYHGPFTRRQDADEILRNKAIADADDIKQTYVVKTLKKLVSIIEAKGDDNFLSVVEVGGKMNMSYLSGSMRVSFKDGSAFTATNSVVLVVNNYGTMFNRFPLTFHDVVMADGSKLRTPSEALMNTVFVGKDA